MTRTLLLSTVMLGAWMVAALAEPVVSTPTPVGPAVTADRASAGQQTQVGRVELTDSQMDGLKAGAPPEGVGPPFGLPPPAFNACGAGRAPFCGPDNH